MHAGVLAAAACVLITAALLATVRRLPVYTLPPVADAGRWSTTTSAASDAAPADAEGPVYAYSVVAGGVRSAAAVARAAERDPVVAAHYAHVRTSALRTWIHEAPRRVYMSYRIGTRIFWTKHPVALPAGELLLTDGTTVIRSRCGNLVAEHPRAPVADDEPGAPEFDRVVAPAPAADGETMTPPFASVIDPERLPLPWSLALGVPAVAIEPLDAIGPGAPGVAVPGLAIPAGTASSLEDPASGGGPPLPSAWQTTEAPLAVVPEPGSLVLVSTGLAAYAFRRVRRARRRTADPAPSTSPATAGK